MEGKQEVQRGKDEYTVKLTKSTKKKFHVMRFKPPHKCNLEDLVNPTLERQTVVKAEEEDMPETGEGSEYGRKRREEARKRRRGYRLHALDPDDHPWILREKKKDSKSQFEKLRCFIRKIQPAKDCRLDDDDLSQ